MLGFSALSEAPISALPAVAAVALALSGAPGVYVTEAPAISYARPLTADIVIRAVDTGLPVRDIG